MFWKSSAQQRNKKQKYHLFIMEKRNDRDDEGESSDELAETVDSITNAGKCKDEKRKHNKLTESEKREER